MKSAWVQLEAKRERSQVESTKCGLGLEGARHWPTRPDGMITVIEPIDPDDAARVPVCQPREQTLQQEKDTADDATVLHGENINSSCSLDAAARCDTMLCGRWTADVGVPG